MKWVKGAFLQDGKGKSLYKVVGHPSLVWMEFKDDLTAFNGRKKSSFKGKGQINRDLSSLIFRFLYPLGIKNHWVADVGERGMICQSLKMAPLEFVVRNRLTGQTVRKFSLQEGQALSQPLVELYYKNDGLGDPFISSEQALAFGFIAQEEDLMDLKKQALWVNQKLKTFFDSVGLELIDFKLEFGKTHNKAKASYILGDEFSCDTCRLWDKKTGEKQDKDRFRLGLGGVDIAYKTVLKSLITK